MREDLATDAVAEVRHLLMDRLREKRVNILLKAEVKEILDDGVTFIKDGQEESIRGAEYVILAVGAKAVDNLSAEIKDKVGEVYVIGDARGAEKILTATASAAAIGREI